MAATGFKRNKKIATITGIVVKPGIGNTPKSSSANQLNIIYFYCSINHKGIRTTRYPERHG
jgi:hypothetical protein